ncbi:MAG: hypothetical protein Q9227_006312 [Pyrenula ochraceoflavens]
MTRFRPCIDLHAGQVKQIVGGTLSISSDDLKTNYISTHSADYYASLYRDNGLTGAHVIMLGPGNDDAAQQALQAWPKALQVGGGITDMNARSWIDAGAEKVIVTSYLFPSSHFSLSRLQTLLKALDYDSDKLVIDLSCRRKEGPTWIVAMNKWQTLTDMEVNQDNEGLQQGIDRELVEKLAQWCSKPVTYAGGGRHLDDLDLVRERSRAKVDLTIGSALDIFGGKSVSFEDCIEWNKKAQASPQFK